MADRANKQVALSVIMPAYNAQHAIVDALQALSNQVFLDFEVLIVDDGSSDDTVAAVERFAQGDSRFSCVRVPHRGAAEARNTGISHAQGKYLLFLDADDVFEPTLLSALFHLAETSKADIAICSADCFTNNPAKPTRPLEAKRYELKPGTYTQEQLASRLFQANSVVVWNKLFRAEFIQDLQLRFQSQPRFNDAYFTLVALAHARILAKTSAVLVHYRVGQQDSLVSSAHNYPLCDLQAFDAVRDELIASGLFTEPLARSFNSLCIHTIMWRLVQFAGVSREACKALYSAYFDTYEKKWNLAHVRFPYIRSLRYAIERRLMKRSGADGLLRACRRGTRGQSSAQSIAAEAGFLMRLAAASVSRSK